jgi:diguanylate cyclase (GGDEF)-like protein
MVEKTQRTEIESLNQLIVERLEFRLNEISRINKASAKQIEHWIDDPIREHYIEHALRSLITIDESYIDVSLITLDHKLSEIARVERKGDDIVSVERSRLRSLGHIKALKLLDFNSNLPLLSEVAKNHIRSLDGDSQVPVIYSVIPISSQRAERIGLLAVIRIDKLMEKLSESLDPSLSIIAANSKGLYLIHPLEEYVFSFTRNAGHNIVDDFPGMTSLLDSDLLHYYIRSSLPWSNERNLTYISKAIFNFHEQEHCYFIATSKPSFILSSLASIYTSTFTIAVILTFIALLWSSGYISQWVISPIIELSKLSNNVDKHPTIPSKYLVRDDEIGTLANAIKIASGNIKQSIDNLESSRDDFKKMAILDPLTQVPNRTCFEIEFPEIIQYHSKKQLQFGLLFVDVDYFKTVNDTYGHIVGDSVLSIISSALQELIGHKDTVFRMGGDEFAIILTNISNELDLEELTFKIREINKLRLRETGYALDFLDMSIGIATFPKDGKNKESLIACADNDMYQRKRAQKINRA